MDPNTPQSAQPEANTTNRETEEAPQRILDILRESVTEKKDEPIAVATEPPVASNPAPIQNTPTPTSTRNTPITRGAEPSLEELGGMRPETEDTVEPPQFGMESRNFRIAPTESEPQDSAPVSAAPPSEERPTFTSGLTMEDIALPERPNISPTPTPQAQPEPEPQTEVPEAPKQKPRGDAVIPSIHTLRDDMQRAVQNQSMSVVRATALEQDRRAKGKTTDDQGGGATRAPKRSPLAFLVPLSITLLLLGGASLGGFWLYYTYLTTPVDIPAETPSLIFAENSQSLDITNASKTVLASKLQTQIRAGAAVSPGAMLHIVPVIQPDASLGGAGTTRGATAAEFLSALSANAPSEIVAALSGNFFLGLHGQDGNQFVLILDVSSYEHAFAGMLEWEATLGNSLSPLFPGAETKPFAGTTFSDVVVRNIDVRMLADGSGNPIILYTFPDRNTLVITANPYTLLEALARVQAAKQK